MVFVFLNLKGKFDPVDYVTVCLRVSLEEFMSPFKSMHADDRVGFHARDRF